MKEYIEERAVTIANYIIDHNATVRQTAKKFGISKSTVHKDVTDRLEGINPSLAAQAEWFWTLIRQNAISAADLPRRRSTSISFRPAAQMRNLCSSGVWQQLNKFIE